MKTLGKALLISGVAILALGAVVAIPIAIKNSQKSSIVAVNKNKTISRATSSGEATTSISGSTSESSIPPDSEVSGYDAPSGMIDGKYYLPFDHNETLLEYTGSSEGDLWDDGYWGEPEELNSPSYSYYFKRTNSNYIFLAIPESNEVKKYQYEIDIPDGSDFETFNVLTFFADKQGQRSDEKPKICFEFNSHELFNSYDLYGCTLFFETSQLATNPNDSGLLLDMVPYGNTYFYLVNSEGDDVFSELFPSYTTNSNLLGKLINYATHYSIIVPANVQLRYTQPWLGYKI